MKHTPNYQFVIPAVVIERYENDFVQIELCENNILVVRLHDELYFDREKSELFMSVVKKMAGGKALRMFMVTGAHSSVDNDSREYFALAEHTQYISKCAAVINSMSQRMIGNFFLRFNKPAIPARLFNDPAEGWNWLIGERDEKG